VELRVVCPVCGQQTETCWASNKICNKNSSVVSSWHFISTYYRRCTVKTTSKKQILFRISGNIIQESTYTLFYKVCWIETYTSFTKRLGTSPTWQLSFSNMQSECF
jgi:C4-type Zn-finger protein